MSKKFVIWSKKTGIIKLSKNDDNSCSIYNCIWVDNAIFATPSMSTIFINDACKELTKSKEDLIKYLIDIKEIPDTDYICIHESPLNVGDYVKIIKEYKDRFPINTIGKIIDTKMNEYNIDLYIVESNDKSYAYLRDDLEEGELKWVSKD